jgi:hypothetical protein
VTGKLIRLGGQYERATLAKDYARAITIEREIDGVSKDAEDVGIWPAPLIVRGRNVVRNARGLEPINV